MRKRWTEIERGRDFFDYEGEVDWMVSNPPFSMISKILDSLFRMCRKGFGLIVGVNNITPLRIQRAAVAGFRVTRMHVFTVKAWLGFSLAFLLFECQNPGGIRIRGSSSRS